MIFNRFLCKKSKGFTLIELLVVIAIIAMISSIVLASLKSARYKARDAQRKMDLHTLQVAIQIYYNEYGAFPPDGTTSSGAWTPAFKAAIAPYLPEPPMDPLVNNGGRYYVAYRLTWATDDTCNGKYVVWAWIEGSNAGARTCGFESSRRVELLGDF